jgi:hypothetical protein
MAATRETGDAGHARPLTNRKPRKPRLTRPRSFRDDRPRDYMVPGVCRPLTEVGRIRIQNGCCTVVTPGVQAAAGQSLDVGLGIYHLRASGHDHAPPRPGLLVVVVGLERSQILPFGRGQLRSAGGTECHVVAIDNVVHRQYHQLAVCDEADPAYRHRGQQPQALVKRQHLQPCVIGGIPWHRAPPYQERPLSPAFPGADPTGVVILTVGRHGRICSGRNSPASRAVGLASHRPDARSPCQGGGADVALGRTARPCGTSGRSAH